MEFYREGVKSDQFVVSIARMSWAIAEGGRDGSSVQLRKLAAAAADVISAAIDTRTKTVANLRSMKTMRSPSIMLYIRMELDSTYRFRKDGWKKPIRQENYFLEGLSCDQI